MADRATEGEVVDVFFDDAFLHHLDKLVGTAVCGQSREEVIQWLVRRQLCDIAGSPGFKDLFFGDGATGRQTD